MNKKLFVVVNAAGKVYAGVSSISGRAMWFDIAGDMEHASSLEATRWKRDTRWLAQAKKSDATAEWKEI